MDIVGRWRLSVAIIAGDTVDGPRKGWMNVVVDVITAVHLPVAVAALAPVG